jgi:hypothetical protein
MTAIPHPTKGKSFLHDASRQLCPVSRLQRATNGLSEGIIDCALKNCENGCHWLWLSVGFG